MAWPKTQARAQKVGGPDPAYWCEHRYVIVNPDARDASMSEGDSYFQGTPEAHDPIAWVATCDWSSGKVGLSGNSWLGMCQRYIAVEQPPHPASIAPWEDFIRRLRLRRSAVQLGAQVI